MLTGRGILLLLATVPLGVGVARAAPPPVDGPAGAGSAASRVQVELVLDGSATPGQVADAVAAAGGRITGDLRGEAVLVEVPAGSLTGLHDAPGVSQVRAPLVLDVRPPSDGFRSDQPNHFGLSTGQQVSLVGADAWHAAGRTGSGVKVAVIDFFDTLRYWDPIEMGPDPVRAGRARCLDRGRDCTATMANGIDEGGEQHGPAVVEVLKDVAPGAEIFIGTASTEDDYFALVDWFADRGVRVLNRSLGSVYDGPGDGRGSMDTIVAYAVSRGILWVNSAGNSGERSYYRGPAALTTVTTAAADRFGREVPAGRYVTFGSGGIDTWLQIDTSPVGSSYLAGVRWAADWDLPPAQRTDYAVDLYEGPAAPPGANPTPEQVRWLATADVRQAGGAAPLEQFGAPYRAGPGQRLYLRIRYVAGPRTNTDVIELLDYSGRLTEHSQAPYSASVPAVDSASPGLVAVGAVDPPGSGRIAPYSSRGPTNDGRTKPDLVAPSGVDSLAFGTFSGTSSSAPVVTGAAALVVGAGFARHPWHVAQLLRSWSVDQGPRGPDNDYGAGELTLPVQPCPTGCPPAVRLPAIRGPRTQVTPGR